MGEPLTDDQRALLRFLYRSPRPVVRSPELIAALHSIMWRQPALVHDVYESISGGFTARITLAGIEALKATSRPAPAEQEGGEG